MSGQEARTVIMDALDDGKLSRSDLIHRQAEFMKGRQMRDFTEVARAIDDAEQAIANGLIADRVL